MRVCDPSCGPRWCPGYCDPDCPHAPVLSEDERRICSNTLAVANGRLARAVDDFRGAFWRELKEVPILNPLTLIIAVLLGIWLSSLVR